MREVETQPILYSIGNQVYSQIKTRFVKCYPTVAPLPFWVIYSTQLIWLFKSDFQCGSEFSMQRRLGVRSVK